MINADLFYDEDDEFQLVKEANDEYFETIHLRTHTTCIIHRHRLRLDLDTPLRLGCDDRGVIQRCFLQHDVPGAYLIRRSKNESNAYVLSVSQVANWRNAEDWHYLIRVDAKTHRFYFTQGAGLAALSFASFHSLVRDPRVRQIIPLSTVIPHRIEFEEDLWHIPKRQLTFQYRIGKGEFGEVWRASWQNGSRSIPVAVKKLHLVTSDQPLVDSFIREIETLKVLRNSFIVALHGVAFDLQTNQTLLVTELMENGDLKRWLKASSDVPDERTIVSFASDICRAMSFVEKQGRVHRDLACRNILLSADSKTVKVADFGLSKLVNKDDFAPCEDLYLQKIPVRWTAPEVLQNPKDFSIASDVWSFGIVLIEIWLKGIDPYPDEKNFAAVEKLVQNGYVHRKPVKCSNLFYNRLILPCLAYEARLRPSFESLMDILRQWHREKVEYERLIDCNLDFSLLE